MTYDKTLPNIDELRSLAETVSTYPVSSGEMTGIARSRGFNEDVRNFICLFSVGCVFKDREDFLTRSKNLTLLIDEERSSPYETPRTPQG